jgi:hypothetical protein
MAEVIPKNHKFFLFFSFSEKHSSSCELSPEKKPLLLAIENLQNHLIIIFISKNGGNNPSKSHFFSFSGKRSPSCEISPERKPLLLAIENLQNHLIFESYNL